MLTRIFLIQLVSFCFLVNMQAQTGGVNFNLLKNGRFAEGTASWEVFLADPSKPIKAQVIEQSDAYEAYGLADNYIGVNFVELDAASAIQQEVATESGEFYTLVFAYAHRPHAGDKQLIVQLNGKAIWTTTIKNSPENGHFIYKALRVIGTDKANISFFVVSLGGDEDKGVLLTDVLFNKEPEVNLDFIDAYQR